MVTPEMIEDACRGMYGSTWDGPADKMPGEKMKDVWRSLASKALTAALAVAPTSVRVKPLVWETARWVGEHGGWIGRAGDEQRVIKVGFMQESPYEFGLDAFQTLEAAKAAAQADYEARILSALEPAPAPEPITARYTNWRGETALRTIIPHRVFFGSNEWHPEPQVLIEATDVEKGDIRTFAAAGFAAAPQPPKEG